MSWGKPEYHSDEQRDINEGLRERGYYPGSPFPFDVFVIESVGLDPTKFPYGERFIYKNGYYTMKTNAVGEWVNNKWHPWTEEQQDIIDKHWRLISNGVKSNYSTGGYTTGYPYIAIDYSYSVNTDKEKLFEVIKRGYTMKMEIID